MTHEQDIWHCYKCGNQFGRHDQFFDGDCEKCHESELAKELAEYRKNIYTIGELRKHLEQFNGDDIVVVEIHEGSRSEDLYSFHIDSISDVKLGDGTEVSEVRLCI